jgi:hypothetical protein
MCKYYGFPAPTEPGWWSKFAGVDRNPCFWDRQSQSIWKSHIASSGTAAIAESPLAFLSSFYLILILLK